MDTIQIVIYLVSISNTNPKSFKTQPIALEYWLKGYQ